MAFSDYIIDKTTPIPMYYQLKNIILSEIKNNTLKQGDMLPTEIDLGKIYGLSRTTTRQALIELVSEGYLYRTKGKGTFVAKPKLVQDFMRRIESYDEQMKRLNMVPSTKVIENKIVSANKVVAQSLNVEVGQDVVLLKRLRYADDEPIVVLDTYLTLECSGLSKMDMEKNGLYNFLAQSQKTKISRVVRQFEATLVKKEEREFLQIEKGHPIQLVTTVGFNVDGKPVEYSVASYRGDKSKFIVELKS
jgi:GntR family transcriptional regulator